MRLKGLLGGGRDDMCVGNNTEGHVSYQVFEDGAMCLPIEEEEVVAGDWELLSMSGSAYTTSRSHVSPPWYGA